MEIQYTMRPTGVRTNARFRGPTESNKYINFVGETAHDLALLGKIMDKDEFIFSGVKGQSNFISDNMAAYYSGVNVPVTSNTPTSTWLYTILEPVNISTDLTTWTKESMGSVTAVDGGYRLVTSATGASGITKQLDVVEGDIIHIRMKLHKVSGTFPGFGIGSANVNQGEGSVATFDASNADGYYDHFIECKHKESISLGIYNAYNKDANGTMDVLGLEINYASVNKINMQPTNTTVKRRINVLEDEIMNIINNM